MAGGNAAIEKAVKNIVTFCVLLLLVTAICWFYEPLAQAEMPNGLQSLMLAFFIGFPVGILVNIKNIKKAL